MMETKNVAVAQIGEHIGQDLGSTMVKSFFDAYPALAFGHTIGKEILEKMLAQPDCAGMTVYPALNETGNPTLVFAGVNAKGNMITSYPVVAIDGSLEFEEGLVVDRVKTEGWYV